MISIRRALETTWWAARAYRASTVLIVATAGTAVAAALPLTWLGSARLALASLRDPDFGITLSVFSATPDTLQRAALASLAGVIALLGIAILGVSIVTILALAMGRADTRRREMTVRRAVGAARDHLRAAGSVEGITFVGVMLALGCPVGVLVLRWSVAAWPGTAAAALFLTVAGVAVVAGAVLWGALWGVRTPGVLRPADWGATTHGLVMPALQLGISLAILICAAQLGQHARDLVGERGSMARQDGEVLQLVGDAAPEERASGYAALLSRLHASRQFSSVSLSSAGTSLGLGTMDIVTTDCGACVEGGVATPFRPAAAVLNAVSSDTFRALGVAVLQGRGIGDHDVWSAPPVAVVSQTLATQDYERTGAVGRKIRIGRGNTSAWYTVVGVVPDRPGAGLGGAFEPVKAVYLSTLQLPPRAADLLLRPATALSTSALGIPGVVVGRTSEVDLVATVARSVKWFESITGIAGVAVLVIAVLGVLAVMELWVAALAPELAVRRAVGARRGHILRYVLARAVGVAGGGVCFGLWVGQLTGDGLDRAVAGLPSVTVAMIARAGALLIAGALVGAMVPAWRAANSAPAEAMATLEG
jgi:hypothetical protein